MPRANLIELQAMAALAAHRRFRAAAAALSMSPSALSHTIASLEQRLGVRLFHRTTRSVSLTPAGTQFLSRVGPALAQIGDAMESVNAFRAAPTGLLRINTAPTDGAARRVLAPLFADYLRRYPDVQLEVVGESRFVDIVAEGFDAGMRLAEAVPQDMIAVPCSAPLSMVVVGSRGYFRRHPRPRTPADLAAHNCIRNRFAGGAMFHWEFEQRGEALRLDVQGTLTVDNNAMKVAAALAGVGLAYLNEWDVADDLKAGRLVRVLEEFTPPFPGLCLYYPGHRHVPAALQALIALIRERRDTEAARPRSVQRVDVAARQVERKRSVAASTRKRSAGS